MSKIKLHHGVHKVIGVMTGNSLDAVDVGLFEAEIGQSPSGIGQSTVVGFRELDLHSVEISSELRHLIGQARLALNSNDGAVSIDAQPIVNSAALRYHKALVAAVNQAIDKFGCRDDVRLVGVHGQTLAHCPPSAMGLKSYTVQMGNGALLANQLNLPVVSDFRSDDVLNGGEGAPFAPIFNAFLLPSLQLTRAYFINAGNTSNIAKIETGQAPTGFDCGPCNHFIDQVVRSETGQAFDDGGNLAGQGRVLPGLLRVLWKRSVVTGSGVNGLALSPPRSFDPQWYRLPDEFAAKLGQALPDRLRTLAAFSALCIANSIALIGQSWPEAVVLFGGGWRNKILFSELQLICDGGADYVKELIQEEGIASDILSLKIADRLVLARNLALPDQGMEAGIFAYAGTLRALGVPFTTPLLTKCKSPTKCGMIFLPGDPDPSIPQPWLSRAAPDNQAAL